MVRGTPKGDVSSQAELLSLPLFSQGVVQAEINLIRNPFCIISKNHLKPKESLVYEEITPNGIKHLWKVIPNIEYGHAGGLDKKVIATVQKLATDQGFPPPRLLAIGSLNGLCRLMKIKEHPKNRQDIRKSLLRIASTTIYTDNFFIKEKNQFWENSLSGGQFTLWNVYWKGKKLPNGEKAQAIFLELNAPFLVSLQSFYTVPLDYDFYISLPPLAQRLYELTRLRFYGLRDSAYARFEYPHLCNVLPVRRQDYFSKAKLAFGRAHKALKDSSWCARIEWIGGAGDKALIDGLPWAVHYYPGKRAVEELARAKDRQAQFQRLEIFQRQLLPPDQWARLDVWVNDLAQTLDGDRNRPFFRLIAYLTITGEISENLIFRLMSEAKEVHYDGQIKKTKSAWFTDQLKRHLDQQGHNFKALIQKAKADLTRPTATTTA